MHDNAGIAGDEFINKRRVAEEVRENLLSKGVSNQEATRSAIRIANNKPKICKMKSLLTRQKELDN